MPTLWDLPKNEIVEEISSGFTLNNRLIRAAKVSVAIPVQPGTHALEEDQTPKETATLRSTQDEPTAEPTQDELVPASIEPPTEEASTEDNSSEPKALYLTGLGFLAESYIEADPENPQADSDSQGTGLDLIQDINENTPDENTPDE